MMRSNTINGRPLKFSDEDQIRTLEEATMPMEVYDEKPGAPWLHVDCLVCAGFISIRKRYCTHSERMVYVTPRIHTCRCGARIVLYRYNNPDYDSWGNEATDGALVYRHLGAYEVLDELTLIHRQDSWRFYALYKILDNDSCLKLEL